MNEYLSVFVEGREALDWSLIVWVLLHVSMISGSQSTNQTVPSHMLNHTEIQHRFEVTVDVNSKGG